MHTKDEFGRQPLALSTVSIASIVCSSIWYISACVYYQANALRNDWSATSLVWMLAVIVTPAVCFTGGMILVDARRRQQLSLLDWWALAAAFLPVTLGTLLAVWATKVLFVMCGAGV